MQCNECGRRYQEVLYLTKYALPVFYNPILLNLKHFLRDTFRLERNIYKMTFFIWLLASGDVTEVAGRFRTLDRYREEYNDPSSPEFKAYAILLEIAVCLKNPSWLISRATGSPGRAENDLCQMLMCMPSAKVSLVWKDIPYTFSSTDPKGNCRRESVQVTWSPDRQLEVYKNDQLPPEASPEILHHTINPGKPWAFIVSWKSCTFTTIRSFSLSDWLMSRW